MFWFIQISKHFEVRSSNWLKISLAPLKSVAKENVRKSRSEIAPKSEKRDRLWGWEARTSRLEPKIKEARLLSDQDLQRVSVKSRTERAKSG